MASQGDGNGLGQQRRHRDALGFHQLGERIQLVGGDGVPDTETRHSEAGLHVPVHRTLEGVEGDGVAGTPEAVARRRTGGRRRRGCAGGNSSCSALSNPGHRDGLTTSLFHVLSLNAAVGAAAAHGAEVHAHLGGQLLGARAGHDPSVRHRRCCGSHRCRSCWGRSRSWCRGRSLHSCGGRCGGRG